ncbi:hypothetical protein MKX01_015005 [Papaver californicum]|nr:hypothetical protein MKX01_015005 [Papaver californicum]
MCSYNKVNGVPTCAHQNLFQGIIRNQWEFGQNKKQSISFCTYIASGCDSVLVCHNYTHFPATLKDVVALALKAGLYMICGDFLGTFTENTVKQGKVSESIVDQPLVNNYVVLMRLGFLNMVTLQNNLLSCYTIMKSLPMNPKTIKTLVVIGPNVNPTEVMISNYAGIPCKYISPLQGLAKYMAVTYKPGWCANVSCSNRSLIEKAVKVVAKTDAVMIVVGLNQAIEAEELDRVNLTLPSLQEKLVMDVANSASVDVSFAKNVSKIVGILWVGYPGQSGGEAKAQVIFGDYNPGGRSPFTWCSQEYIEHVPMKDMNMRANTTQNFPGRTYRFYAGPTLYNFGHGLNYSIFFSIVKSAPSTIEIPMQKSQIVLTPNTTNLSEFNSGDDVDIVKVDCQTLQFNIEVVLIGFERVEVMRVKQESVKIKIDFCKELNVADAEGKRKMILGKHTLVVGSSSDQQVRHILDVRVNESEENFIFQ